MRNILRNILIGLLIVVASIAYGAVPTMTVAVADATGKTTYKGATDAKGTFATGTLKPGNYVVQFNSKAAPKGSSYALVVAAGKKKVTATAITAEKLAAGGVAMRIDVGAGLNITGQVAAADKTTAPLGKNGKPMVWIGKRVGTNIAPHWAESDSAEAQEALTASGFSIKNIQDKQSQGITPQ